jgi:hypothetical protein
MKTTKTTPGATFYEAPNGARFWLSNTTTPKGLRLGAVQRRSGYCVVVRDPLAPEALAKELARLSKSMGDGRTLDPLQVLAAMGTLASDS